MLILNRDIIRLLREHCTEYSIKLSTSIPTPANSVHWFKKEVFYTIYYKSKALRTSLNKQCENYRVYTFQYTVKYTIMYALSIGLPNCKH